MELNYIKDDKENKYVKRVLTLDDYPEVKGWDFSQSFDFDKFINQYFHTGFQETNLKKAIDVIKEMKKEKAKIFLAFTSNMVSSGLREAICYLVKNKLVDVLVTTAGGVEEDMIKSLKKFVIGDFSAPGSMLLENGINRTGNIFVPNDRYYLFEKNLVPFLERMHEKQQGKPISCEEFLFNLGEHINHEESILYWAWKNKIPFFCPAITDGALGDMLYFFKKRKKDFYVDVTQDMTRIVDLAMNSEKTGLIVLGGGVVKHHVLNAQIFREGCDYAVFVNTGQEFDGSDSGARPDEAVSWCKIKPDGKAVKVTADATLVFPLMVQACFTQNI
ncbi:deoxyhypusine synthase [Candidatus Woesearchaeota archaeon]|nr:deoxyhypusine synthase [Candidatus Woesearchaeota archaeon]